MRAVTVLHYYYGFPHVKVFSREYKGMAKDRMLKKIKHWAFLHYRKEYDSGVLQIIYYEDIADISTAEVIPL